MSGSTVHKTKIVSRGGANFNFVPERSGFSVNSRAGGVGGSKLPEPGSRELRLRLRKPLFEEPATGPE
jgi:hypothetical protein